MPARKPRRRDFYLDEADHIQRGQNGEHGANDQHHGAHAVTAGRLLANQTQTVQETAESSKQSESA